MALDTKQPFIIVREHVLTAAECAAMIERIEATGPAPAPITTAFGPVMKPSIRNNTRVIFDDPAYAEFLFDRIKAHVPQEFLHRKLVGANERLRCYRYDPGQYFAPHADGAFVRDDQERSFYTFMVYLNEDFEGGATTFLTEPEKIITPKTGMALFFQHPITHEGSEVTRGTKYVVRSDLMYRYPSIEE